MVVIFYRTTAEGSREVARVENRGGVLDGPRAYVDLLLGKGQGIEQAMRDAPRRFDGAYLRAEFQP